MGLTQQILHMLVSQCRHVLQAMADVAGFGRTTRSDIFHLHPAIHATNHHLFGLATGRQGRTLIIEADNPAATIIFTLKELYSCHGDSTSLNGVP